MQIPSLFAWRSGAREAFEVKDKSVSFSASGGDRFAVVLEFEFLSRIRLHAINDVLSPWAASVSEVIGSASAAPDACSRSLAAPMRQLIHALRNNGDFNAR